VARKFDPLLAAVIDVISERVPDFDTETLEDLIEVVADDLWVAVLGPAVDQVMARVGLDPSVGRSEDEANQALQAAANQAFAGAPDATAIVSCECPHCHHKFMTTLESIVKRESDKCPSCGQEIVPEPITEGGP
jgi:peptide subunit release factor 1 (eRF1)